MHRTPIDDQGDTCKMVFLFLCFKNIFKKNLNFLFFYFKLNFLIFPDCFCVIKIFLKKIKYIFYLFQINFFNIVLIY